MTPTEFFIAVERMEMQLNYLVCGRIHEALSDGQITPDEVDAIEMMIRAIMEQHLIPQFIELFKSSTSESADWWEETRQAMIRFYDRLGEENIGQSLGIEPEEV